MGRDVRSELASKFVFLDRIKNVSAFAKIVLSVGKELSEVNYLPLMQIDQAKFLQVNGTARVVFGLANKLFKVHVLFK